MADLGVFHTAIQTNIARRRQLRSQEYEEDKSYSSNF